MSHRWMRMAGDDAEFEQLMYSSMNPCSDDTEPNDAVLEHMSKLGLDKDHILAVSVCHGTSSLSVYFITDHISREGSGNDCVCPSLSALAFQPAVEPNDILLVYGS